MPDDFSFRVSREEPVGFRPEGGGADIAGAEVFGSVRVKARYILSDLFILKERFLEAQRRNKAATAQVLDLLGLASSPLVDLLHLFLEAMNGGLRLVVRAAGQRHLLVPVPLRVLCVLELLSNSLLFELQHFL